jgi:hypothetical protein
MSYMKRNEEAPVYEMQPARVGLGIIGRFLVLCVVIAAICAAMGFRLSYAPTPHHEDASMLWFFLAFLVGGFAMIVGALKWVFTGRL